VSANCGKCWPIPDMRLTPVADAGTHGRQVRMPAIMGMPLPSFQSIDIMISIDSVYMAWT
jgi:hypothetical protein